MHENNQESVRTRDAVVLDEILYAKYVNEKLREAEEWAAKPGAVWRSHEEVMKNIRDRYGLPL